MFQNTSSVFFVHLLNLFLFELLPLNALIQRKIYKKLVSKAQTSNLGLIRIGFVSSKAKSRSVVDIFHLMKLFKCCQDRFF